MTGPGLPAHDSIICFNKFILLIASSSPASTAASGDGIFSNHFFKAFSPGLPDLAGVTIGARAALAGAGEALPDDAIVRARVSRNAPSA